MKTLTKSLLSAMALTIAPVVAVAHSGHGVLSGALHGLEPVHALPVVAVIAITYWLVRRKQRKQKV